MKNVNSRVGRWYLDLTGYQFNVYYRPGPENIDADWLSRNPAKETFGFNCEKSQATTNFITKENVTNHQLKFIRELTSEYDIQILDDETIIQHQQKFGRILKKTKTIDGVIFKLVKGKKLIYITDSLVPELLEKFHNTFGHVGTKQMNLLISRNYYIENASKIIKEFVDRCATCAKNKTRFGKSLGQLSRIGPATKPLEIVSIDTVGGFSNFGSKNRKYLHIAVDSFSRYVWTLCSNTQEEKDFEKLINIVQTQTNSKVELVVADLYSAINSKGFKKFLKDNNSEYLFTTPDAAQSNGLVERVNQTLVNRIRCNYNERKDRKKTWTTCVKEEIPKYNSTPHTVTGYPPEYLLHGILKETAFIENPIESIEIARKIAYEKSERNHLANSLRYNKKKKPTEFEVGDFVYIKNKNKISRRKLEEFRSI
jgi:transposase InsO family protein